MHSLSRSILRSRSLSRTQLHIERHATRHLTRPWPLAPHATFSTTRPRHTPEPSQSPRTSPTHYDLFPQTLSTGPPPSGPFDIDLTALRAEFLRLQAVTHPDRHPAEAKAKAEAMSSRVNGAYKTLQDPLLRAQYLLSLRGIDVAEDETATVEDPELLMEVLELREAIEGAESEEEIEEMKPANTERIRECVQRLDKAFRDDELHAAKEAAVKLRYWVNVQQSLDAWEKGKPVVLVH